MKFLCPYILLYFSGFANPHSLSLPRFLKSLVIFLFSLIFCGTKNPKVFNYYLYRNPIIFLFIVQRKICSETKVHHFQSHRHVLGFGFFFPYTFWWLCMKLSNSNAEMHFKSRIPFLHQICNTGEPPSIGRCWAAQVHSLDFVMLVLWAEVFSMSW